MYNTNVPQRLEEETYEEYKTRQKFNKIVEKQKKQGHLYWNSYYYGEATPEKIKAAIEQLMLEELKKTQNGD